MDDVISFTTLSLGVITDPTAMPGASSAGTSNELLSTPLSTSSGSTGDSRFGSSVGLYYCGDANAILVRESLQIPVTISSV
jgi:hypothetical protein